MKIAFNMLGTGLGNNGGSRTIVKCAETLQCLGHEVFVISSSNKYKWGTIKVPVIPKMPTCDAVVATGIGSVPSTVSANAPGKFYYIRGFETWRVSVGSLIKSYKSLKCIVNSEWLQSALSNHGVSSHVVYPGLDFDDFYMESEEREPILGGLFNKKHATKRHEDVISVGKNLGIPVKLLNRDIQNPTPSQLRAFYNSIMVWMSPSELEGLHNPPHEASLCGANLVGTDHKRGGIQDYAKNDDTALLYPARNIQEASERVHRLINNIDLRKNLQSNMQIILKNKIGTRHENMGKFANILAGEGI